MAGNEHTYETGSRDFNVIVDHYGDAKGTKSEFKDSQPEKINTLIAGIYRTNRFAYETLQPELEGIKADIIACWQGENADKALNIVATLSTDASTIGDNTRKCGDALSTFQSDWINLKSQASGLYEGVAGTGLNQDNDGAHRIYDAFTKSMDTAMHTMPSELVYHTPLSSDKYDHVGPPGPGPSGPGPGGFGPGTGPGGIGPGTGPGIGPGTGPGYGPGTGPGGIGPGTGPGGGIGPGGIGSGTGVDTGAGLAGFDGGGAGGFGAGDAGGVGPGGGIGPGSGAGAGGGGAGLSGGGAGGGAGLVGGGAGAGGAGAAAAGGRGMMPMHGGQGGDEEERERSTWLTEDDDIWGGEDGLPPVLQ